MDIQKVDKEWNAVIISYFNPVGFYVSSRIGENPNGIHNNLIPYICQVVVGKELNFWDLEMIIQPMVGHVW